MALKKKEEKQKPQAPAEAERLALTAQILRFVGDYYGRVRFNAAKTEMFQALRAAPDIELVVGEGFRLAKSMVIVQQRENEEKVNTDKLLEMVEKGELTARDLVAMGSFAVSKVKEFAPQAIEVRPLTEEEVEATTVVTLRDNPEFKDRMGELTPLFDELFTLLEKAIRL